MRSYSIRKRRARQSLQRNCLALVSQYFDTWVAFTWYSKVNNFKGHFLPQMRETCDALSFPTLREKCPYSEFFWSLFSRIWTEYGEIKSKCGKIRTRKAPNTDTFHAVLGIASHQIFEISCLTLINHHWWKVAEPERRYWLVSLLLTLTRFHLLFWCLHCWLWASKYRSGKTMVREKSILGLIPTPVCRLRVAR